MPLNGPFNNALRIKCFQRQIDIINSTGQIYMYIAYATMTNASMHIVAKSACINIFFLFFAAFVSLTNMLASSS